MSRRTDNDLLDAWRWPTDISQTTYADPADTERYVRIMVSARDDELDVLSRLLIGPVRIFPDSTSLPRGFDQDVVLGLSPSGDTRASRRRWNDGDATVTVSSSLPLGELLELLPAVGRVSTTEDWREVQRQAIDAQAALVIDRPISVDDGHAHVRFAAGQVGAIPWSASVDPADGLVVEINDRTNWLANVGRLGGITPIMTISTTDLTLAMTTVPVESSATRMVVWVAGQAVAQATLVDLATIDPASAFAGRIGALAFGQTGPYVVQVLDADGAVVQEFASPGVLSSAAAGRAVAPRSSSCRRTTPRSAWPTWRTSSGFDGGDDVAFGDEGPRSKWLPAIAALVVLSLIGGGVIASRPVGRGRRGAARDDAAAADHDDSRTSPAPPCRPRPTGSRVDDRLPVRRSGDVPARRAVSAGSDSDRSMTYRRRLVRAVDQRRCQPHERTLAGRHDVPRPQRLRRHVAWRHTARGRSRRRGRRHPKRRRRQHALRRLGPHAVRDRQPVRLHAARAARGGRPDDGRGPTRTASTTEPCRTPSSPAPRCGSRWAWRRAGSTRSGSCRNPMRAPGTRVRSSRGSRSRSPRASHGRRSHVRLPAADGRRARSGAGGEGGSPRPEPRRLPARAHPNRPGSLIASWRSNRGEVSITYHDVPIGTLLDLLPTVRLAEADEWIDLLDRSSRGDLPAFAQAGDSEVVSTSVGGRRPQDDASWWLVDVTAGASPWVFISAVSTGWAGPLGDVPPVPTVHRFASSTMTFLVGTVPWTSAATTMRVTVEGQPPVDVPLVVVSKAMRAAAHAFPELSAFTVEFLDAAGNPVTV